MLFQALTIARNTFVESLRQPIYLMILLICGLLMVMSTWATAFSMGYTTSAEVSGDDKLLLDIGLATVFVCGSLLAAFVATAVLSREIENKTVLTVVSKPVGRTTVILGKYIGVSAAITLAMVIMLAFVLWGIRHGVMSRASDELDAPVLVFALGSVGLSLTIAAWCNFFYGWSFPQTAVTLMAPACAIGYMLTLPFDENWKTQPVLTDFNPQIMLACSAILMSMYVLTAIATAASARLGQVMTIMACSGFFLFGLLSNHLIGRHAFENTYFGKIQSVEYANPDDSEFDHVRMSATLTLDREPDIVLESGESLYYGASPNGFAMAVGKNGSFEGDLSSQEGMYGESIEPALIIVSIPDPAQLEIRLVGNGTVPTSRPPESGDFVFLQPTHVNYAAAAAWGIIPNMQYFWLLDAVSQAVVIPPAHIAKILWYTLAQIGAALSIAVLLFERRDVG